jgi:hypothetical protein
MVVAKVLVRRDWREALHAGMLPGALREVARRRGVVHGEIIVDAGMH